MAAKKTTSSESDLLFTSATGEFLTINNRPIVNPKSSELDVKGLTPYLENAPLADTFGESGDVFNHLLWRNVLGILWTFQETRRSLLGLISMFCMRGKGVRIQHKGTTLQYNLPLPPITDERRTKYSLLFGTDLTYPLKINFPKDSSKVPGAALTMERFKCVTRMFTVPEMMAVRRLTAVCAASGYEDLFKGYCEYADEYRSKVAGKDFVPVGEEAVFWDALLKNINDKEILTRFNAAAIAAGSISTKEVYLEDEAAIIGTIWWTGVNAMMTDAYNRIKAQTASVEAKTRLENSAFYSDFKRKMAARNIVIVFGAQYVRFLEAASNAITRYLKRGSAMSADENRILDAILEKARTSAATATAPQASTSSASMELEGTTSSTLRDSLMKNIGKLQLTTSKSYIEHDYHPLGSKTPIYYQETPADDEDQQ